MEACLLLEDDELVVREQNDVAIEGGGVGLGCWSVNFALLAMGWGQLWGCEGVVGELITDELIRVDENGVGVFI